MAAMDSSGWNHQDQSLQSTADDEFNQFFEMQRMSNMGDGLNFDFHSFQDSSASGLLPQSQRDHMDTSMSGTDQSLTTPTTSGLSQEQQMAAMTAGTSHQSLQDHMGRMPPTPTDPISDIDAQIQYLQQQRLQEQHRQMREQQSTYYSGSNNRLIPPTPRSLDLQAGNAQFFSPLSTPMFDARVHLKDTQQDMSFTPLVSPAVTPLDPHFNLDNAFALPATYFSPITSPALHAQNDPNAFLTQHLHRSVVNTSSPLEMDLEPSYASPQESFKKARKLSTSKPARKTNVRQSPITKPQRRKPASSGIVNQVLNEAVEASSAHSQACSPNVTNGSRDDTDENNSVSPEALSEMPPPPVPASKAGKGKPTANGKQKSSADSKLAPLPLAAMPSPATPASLMKLASSSSSSNALRINTSPASHRGHVSSEPVEAMFELPDPVAPLCDEQFSLGAPVQSQTTTAVSHSGRTPTLQATQPPAFGRPSGTLSANQSPMLGPGSSTPTARRTPQLAPRGSKKRQGSVTASPALLPRISPSIKPLLPSSGGGGETEEDTASRLLTTKSNYQNILEGNKVPGVSYPTELSTGLTSKRTSHKIAEQGRRNRINSALLEIAALLPPSKSSDDAEEKEKREAAKNGTTTSSKASTVEMAIDYIKQLKEEVVEAKRRAEEAEKKLKMREAGTGEALSPGEEKTIEVATSS